MSTAVILAARKEQESQIPYPLQDFETGYGATNLMARTLSILKELRYEHVYIVTGYKRELFAPYACDWVQLVYNKDYAFTSSMGSLAMVEPLVKEDFVLIESDTFFEKKVLEQLTETSHTTCFSVTEESGSGDEAYVQTRNGFVEKISKDGHQMLHIDGEMIGVTKVSLDHFHRMCRLYDSGTNKRVNYEYLLLDVTREIDRPLIYFRNLVWGEIDNERDFGILQSTIYPRLRRKEDPYDRDNLEEHLRNIFRGNSIGTDWQIVQIGGMSNKNFKVVSPENKEYVLRIPGFGAEGMVVRASEDANGKLACDMGLSPEIVYFDDKSGVKLTRFVHNAETLNGATIQRMDNMRQVAEVLRRLHLSKVRFDNEFNIFHEIVKYEHLLEQAGGKMYAGYEEVRQRVMGLEGYLNQLGVDIRPCHDDLVAENFIKDEQGKVWLIDWEYSGMNDPAADFAALFLESDFSADNAEYVLSEYFKGGVPENMRKKIRVYQVLWDYLWTIWTVIKEAQGDNFGDYGPMRYQRAIENLKRIREQEEI